jgi:hypothetical protein
VQKTVLPPSGKIKDKRARNSMAQPVPTLYEDLYIELATVPEANIPVEVVRVMMTRMMLSCSPAYLLIRGITINSPMIPAIYEQPLHCQHSGQ